MFSLRESRGGRQFWGLGTYVGWNTDLTRHAVSGQCGWDDRAVYGGLRSASSKVSIDFLNSEISRLLPKIASINQMFITSRRYKQAPE